MLWCVHETHPDNQPRTHVHRHKGAPADHRDGLWSAIYRPWVLLSNECMRLLWERIVGTGDVSTGRENFLNGER